MARPVTAVNLQGLPWGEVETDCDQDDLRRIADALENAGIACEMPSDENGLALYIFSNDVVLSLRTSG